MRAEGHAATYSARPPVPRPPSEADAPADERQRAGRRLRRLRERQATDGDPAELRSPPARILALFR